MPPPPTALRTARFQALAPVPPEPQRFTKLINVNTRRAYWQDIHGFVAFAVLRRREQPHDITRTHVVACIPGRELAPLEGVWH
jgi:integrase/recombinase XerD